MSHYLVLTFIGPDQPGLVERISQIITSHEANWLESRMAHLAGKFAGILRVEVPEKNAASLQESLQNLSSQDFTLVVEQGHGASAPTSTPSIFHLDLIGNDRPGIIREISQALAHRNVNVEELETECSSAPMSGETIFRAQARLRIPDDLDLDELRSTLEEIASDLMVDLNLEESRKP